MPAKESELCVGSDVTWLHKGKRPYEGQVVELPTGIADNRSKKRKVQCKFYYSSHFERINPYNYVIVIECPERFINHVIHSYCSITDLVIVK